MEFRFRPPAAGRAAKEHPGRRAQRRAVRPWKAGGLALLAASAWALVPAATGADDWPQFRGSQGQGIARAQGLPLRWSDTENVAWKCRVPGLGWSSPVVKEDRVYLTTAVALGEDQLPAQSLRAVCIDSGTGRILWNVEVFRQPPGQRIHKKNSHASPTPIIDGDRVYVHFGTQGTACLNRHDGRIHWQTRTLVYEPVHGSGGSPLLVDGLLVVNCDGGDTQFVAALDALTGNLVWKTPRQQDPAKGFSFCTPLLIEVGGAKQIVSPGSDAVVAYDPSGGRPIWQVAYRGGYSVVPRPVHGNGLVYVCTGYDAPTLLAIRPQGAAGDVTQTHVAWKVKGRVPLNPSPLLVGQRLYLVSDDGVATCLDAVSGQQVWQQRLGGDFSASPVYADGRVYLQSEQGEGIVLQEGDRFIELARNHLGEQSLASYAVGSDSLFIRTQQHLLRVRQSR